MRRLANEFLGRNPITLSDLKRRTRGVKFFWRMSIIMLVWFDLTEFGMVTQA